MGRRTASSIVGTTMLYDHGTVIVDVLNPITLELLWRASAKLSVIMTTQLAEPRTLSVLDAIHRRRAVRSYLSTPVDDEAIQQLLDAAVHAPTAMHAEPWSFVVVQDRDVLKRISERAKALMLERVTPHRELLCAPGATPDGDHLTMLTDPHFNIFYDAGTLVVICARPLNEFASADCWLAAENLMLAAWALGLGTCCIGFALPALHTPEVKHELGITEGIEPIAAVIVGVPRGDTPVVSRRPPQILRWLRSPTLRQAQV